MAHLADRLRLIAIALLLPHAAAAQAPCLQGDAVYADPELSAELVFSRNPEAAMVTNSFTLTVRDTKLDGVVMWTADPLRPDAQLMHGCPQGDVTGTEIEACTPWRGVVYAVAHDGSAGLLPGEDEPAARAVILPDLALSLSTAETIPALAGKPAPFDVFTFRECRR